MRLVADAYTVAVDQMADPIHVAALFPGVESAVDTVSHPAYPKDSVPRRQGGHPWMH